MGGPSRVDEYALVYQCAFCGSYALWVIGVLDRHEVQVRVKFSKLRHQHHDVEQDIMLAASRSKCEDKVSFLPCTTCIEYHRCMSYNEILAVDWARGRSEEGDARALGAAPIGLSPHVPVRFTGGGPQDEIADDDLPPVYRCVSDKWTLAQGVGPKVLEIMKGHDSMNRLAAQQFKVLLKGKVFPLLAARSKQGPRHAVSRTQASQPAETACPGDDVCRFLEFVWSEVEQYEDRLRDALLGVDGAPANEYVDLGNFIRKPVFCFGSDGLAVLEEWLRAA